MLQAVHDSFDYIIEHSTEKIELNDEFMSQLKSHVDSKSISTKIVDVLNVERAYNLLTFFTKNKLVLSDYKIDLSTNLVDIFTKLVAAPIPQTPVVSEDIKLKNKIINAILLNTNKNVSLHEINQILTNKIKKQEVMAAVAELTLFGTLEYKTNARSCDYFIKEQIVDFSSEILDALQNFSVDLLKFKNVNSNLTSNYIF
jgi:hypothetical protein